MKARKSEITSVIEVLIQSFKYGNNLPFTIPTKTCPELRPSKKIKPKKCKKRHSEIVVKAYLVDSNKFHLLYYGIHDPKIVFEYDQEEDLLKSIIKKAFTKKKFGGKTMLEVKKIKKLLHSNKIRRTEWLHLRVSTKELSEIKSKARTRKMEVSDYQRMKLLT